MEKVRKGLALLIVGLVAFIAGVVVVVSMPDLTGNITLALLGGGAGAFVVGLVWVVTGLWRGSDA